MREIMEKHFSSQPQDPGSFKKENFGIFEKSCAIVFYWYKRKKFFWLIINESKKSMISGIMIT